MAGHVVQQPFSLSFQVDALHSSSISFGRFELESLSWERRSSFSHNRYLEEVEKYAKPGSVTEKKAYFEAHFKKRALLRQASSESQAERDGSNSESSSSSTITCEEVQKDLIHIEEPQQTVENRDHYHFDESPKGSSDGDFRAFEYEAGFAPDLHLESHTVPLSSIDDTNSSNEVDTRIKSSSVVDDLCDREHDYESMFTDHLEITKELAPHTVYSVENVKWSDNMEARESELTCYQDSLLNVPQNVNLESESNNQTPDELKEQCISECTSEGLINQPSKTLMFPDKARSSGLRSQPGADVLLNGNVEVKKGIARTNSRKEIQSSPLRSRAKKQVSETIAPSQQSSLRQLPKENPQNSKSKSPQTKRSSEKEVRPRRAATPQPSTPGRNEPQRPRSAISSTRQIASYRKEIGQSVMNSGFRCSGGAEKEVRPKRAATPRPSTPEMSESLRPRSAISSTRQIASYRKEIGQSIKNSSFQCSGGAEQRREKIMAAGTRQLSRKPDLKENPKLCPVSNTPSRDANREKPQMVASNRSSAKASIRTLKTENQTRTGSKLCSTSIVNEAVSASKFAGSRIRSSLDKGTDVHKINNTNITASTRNRVMEANKRKEVVCTKEIGKESKPKARQHGEIVKKLMEVTKKAELGRSGHSFLRKSMGVSVVADHRAVFATATPKVGGPGGNGNALFRKSMGHTPL